MVMAAKSSKLVMAIPADAIANIIENTADVRRMVLATVLPQHIKAITGPAQKQLTQTTHKAPRLDIRPGM